MQNLAMSKLAGSLQHGCGGLYSYIHQQTCVHSVSCGSRHELAGSHHAGGWGTHRLGVLLYGACHMQYGSVLLVIVGTLSMLPNSDVVCTLALHTMFMPFKQCHTVMWHMFSFRCEQWRHGHRCCVACTECLCGMTCGTMS